MSEDQPSPRFVPRLDEMLTREQCAAWLGVTERWLQENKKSVIPFNPSHRTVMYHPRTILAKMAFDAGVPLQIVAASHGIVNPDKKL